MPNRMPDGRGPYGDLCSTALISAQAAGCVLLIVHGDKGSGFAVHTTGPDVDRALPALLRLAADQIDRDIQAGFFPSAQG